MDNLFFVGAAGDHITILKPVPPRLSKQEALNLAAWIVAIADPLEDDFKKVFEAVCNT